MARHAFGKELVPLRQADAVAFAVNHRPARSARGSACVNLRHGVSRLHAGHRHIPLASSSTTQNRAARHPTADSD
ncbi:2OG-Fe(II) oxygenase [Camelimonas fluminis]